MIGFLSRFIPGGSLGVYILLGVVLFSVLGGVWYRAHAYVKTHEQLVEEYDRQSLALNQALQVNLHNIDEMARLKQEHDQTILVLESQRTTEIETRIEVETQIERLQRIMRETKPEIVYVEGEQCPPQFDVHPVLFDPFGRMSDSSEDAGGDQNREGSNGDS